MINSNLVWDMNKFYSYKEFEAMPDDVKIKYLQNITDKYEIGSVTISTVLFECGKSTLCENLKRHGLDKKIKWCSFRGPLATEKYEKFKIAVMEERNKSTIEDEKNQKKYEEKEFHDCELCNHSNVCKYEETIKKYKKSVNQMGFDGSSDNISINISIRCKYYIEKV